MYITVHVLIIFISSGLVTTSHLVPRVVAEHGGEHATDVPEGQEQLLGGPFQQLSPYMGYTEPLPMAKDDTRPKLTLASCNFGQN
jgi:hypothetical protein